jgi:hypothetical protein
MKFNHAESFILGDQNITAKRRTHEFDLCFVFSFAVQELTLFHIIGLLIS